MLQSRQRQKTQNFYNSYDKNTLRWTDKAERFRTIHKCTITLDMPLYVLLR